MLERVWTTDSGILIFPPTLPPTHSHELVAGTAEIEKDGHRNDFTEVGGQNDFTGTRGLIDLASSQQTPFGNPRVLASDTSNTGNWGLGPQNRSEWVFGCYAL